MTAGFYVGPGDWLYYVDSSGKVTIAYSPTSKAWIYRALDTATAAKVRAELEGGSGWAIEKSSGVRYLGANATEAKAAYAKIRPESAKAPLTYLSASSGSSSSSSGKSSYSAPAPLPPAPVAPPSLWDQAAPYAPYAIVGVSALLALYLVLTPPAPTAARSAT